MVSGKGSSSRSLATDVGSTFELDTDAAVVELLTTECAVAAIRKANHSLVEVTAFDTLVQSFCEALHSVVTERVCHRLITLPYC